MRKAAKRRKARNEKQIRKAAEKQAEKAIEIARDEPSRPGALHRVRDARDVGFLAAATLQS